MGMSSDQVGETSLWKHAAEVEGYNKANTPADAKSSKLSDAEFDSISQMLDEEDD